MNLRMLEASAIAALSDAELDGYIDEVAAALELDPQDRNARAMFTRISDVTEREARSGR